MTTSLFCPNLVKYAGHTTIHDAQEFMIFYAAHFNVDVDDVLNVPPSSNPEFTLYRPAVVLLHLENTGYETQSEKWRDVTRDLRVRLKELQADVADVFPASGLDVACKLLHIENLKFLMNVTVKIFYSIEAREAE